MLHRQGAIAAHAARVARQFEFAANDTRGLLMLPFCGVFGFNQALSTWAAGAPRAADGDARLLEWMIRLPARADVDGAAASLGAAGYDIRRDADDAVVGDPWGTNLRLTTV